MFEKDIITLLLEQKKEYLNYKIIHHCRKCGKRIDTFWTNNELDGSFLSDDSFWSEYLDITVTDPQTIICWSCAGPGKYLQ